DSDSDADSGTSDEDFSDLLFDPATIIEVEIEMNPADWDAVRTETRDTSGLFESPCLTEPFYSPFTYKPAMVTVDGEVFEQVGVRKKGFLGSINSDRPSLKVSFDEYVEGQECRNMHRLTLNNNLQDGSQVKQCLAYGLFAAAGVPAPRCNFAHVTVNGQDLGIYTNVESYKKRFIARHFDDNEGRLYEGTFSDFHDEWIATFEPKTDEDNEDRSDLQAIKAALELPDSELEAALSELVDLDEFMHFWAVESLVNHGDGYATNRNNYYIYFDPTTGLANFMPWGADGTFGDNKFNDGVTFVGSMLTRRLYGLPATQARYVAVMSDLLDTIWDEEALLAEADRMKALIAPFFDSSGFAGQVDAVKDYISGRRATFEPVLDDPPAFDDPFPQVPCEEFGGGGGKP
ncbi:MAG: hypothetical protein GY854_23760, partial [Deltaproteobacteria bacterium]|nr:hypothetical protein [Deltaproteobacteria bacterium]